MGAYVFDTSALVKRYVVETGSQWVTDVLDPAAGHDVYIGRITTVEVTAALTRRARGGSISATDVASALAQFRADVLGRYAIVGLSDAVVDLAADCAERHGLRAYDAVQLAIALEVRAALASRGLAVTLVSSDHELNGAATTDGLAFEDPNAYP